MCALGAKPDHWCNFSLSVNYEGYKVYKTLMLARWDICMEVSSWGLFRAHDQSSLAGGECCSIG